MKKIYLLLTITFLFSGELEVDGDLNVTGNINSQTIDSLLVVIANLQSQILALQSSGIGLETRIYQLQTYTAVPYQDEEHIFNLSEITGTDLDFALVRFHSLDNFYVYNNNNEYYWGTEFNLSTEKHLVYPGNDFWASDCNIVTADLKPNNLPYTLSSTGHCLMHEHSRLKMDYGGTHGGGNFTISIAVTAQF